MSELLCPLCGAVAMNSAVVWGATVVGCPCVGSRDAVMVARVDCDECYGRGWFPETVAGTEDDYIPDYNEKYCDCEAGKRLRVKDGAA